MAQSTMAPEHVGAVAAPSPVSDYDPYLTEHLLDPHPGNAALRQQGGVVWLSRHNLYALPRYETTRGALDNWQHFSSGMGVMLNDVMNDFMRGTLLCSDPPEHDVKRKVIMRPLTPAALRTIRDDITVEADPLVERLCAQGAFNAATELAEHLPLSIVANRVGMPAVERTSMLDWGRAAFDCIGPIELERTQKALTKLGDFGGFVTAHSARDQCAKGSWLEGLYEAADEGLISHETCGAMAVDYIGPSLDTTISALSSAIWLFATNPEQWDILRDRSAMIPNAVNEIVRLEAPIQGWTHYVSVDTELDGVPLPKGSRVLVMFASANRDERKWADADTFDVTRSVSDHVGFGHGEHGCAGANLARWKSLQFSPRSRSGFSGSILPASPFAKSRPSLAAGATFPLRSCCPPDAGSPQPTRAHVADATSADLNLPGWFDRPSIMNGPAERRSASTLPSTAAKGDSSHGYVDCRDRRSRRTGTAMADCRSGKEGR